MDQRRIDAAPLLAGLGALVLLVSLFLDWYEPGLSAWTTFEFLDLLLAGLAIAALLAMAESLGVARLVNRRFLLAIGAITFVVVASQLIDRPPAAEDAGLEVGAWLAFAASLMMLVGGIAAGAAVSLAVSVDRRPHEGAGPGAEAPPASAPGTAAGPEAVRRPATEDTSATVPMSNPPDQRT